MSAPLVSIVIATYRSRHDHLLAAIGSALVQSMGDIEIIVSDDSPDDALSELVASFHDERLRYRHNAPALGVARNHWLSFGEARGEFIVILNHDDWLAPSFVERLASALQAEPQAVLAFCDHWVIDVDGERLVADTERNTAAWGRAQLGRGLHRSFAPLVAAQTIPMAMGAMFRRAALPAVLPGDAGPAYDLWLTYLLCRTGGAAWYESERLSAWRTHAGNLTHEGGLEWLHGTATCWAAMARDGNFATFRQLARRRAAESFNGCATRSWAHGQRVRCVHYAWKSLVCSPTVKAVASLFMLPLLPSCWAPERWARGAAIVRRSS